MAAKMLKFVNVYAGSTDTSTKKLCAHNCQRESRLTGSALLGCYSISWKQHHKVANRQMRASLCLGETALGAVPIILRWLQDPRPLAACGWRRWACKDGKSTP